MTRRAATIGGFGRSPATWAKIIGLTVLLVVLLSFNYAGLALSSSVTQKPLQLIVVAFVDTVIMGYLVTASRWKGRMEWLALFSAFYGVNYALTTIEAVYLPTVLPASTVFNLLLNGAIVSGVFAAALVAVLGERGMQEQTGVKRLAMPAREWIWKTIAGGIVYIILFIIFGAVVYGPLAKSLDAAAYAAEQSSGASAGAALIFPTEILRGAIWVLLGVPVIMSLPFGWRKTGVIMGIVFAVPLSGFILLSTTIAAGLVPAHFVEVITENFVFGILVTWILQRHDRLPALSH